MSKIVCEIYSVNSKNDGIFIEFREKLKAGGRSGHDSREH